jgi:uncharacterized protein YydD (DUF2326 family)
MFLKSLLISTPTKVIREINFHKGLNLIVDDTPNSETSTGNNVGKTTILKLIDFCLGRDGSVIYKDPENKREEYKIVKDFLINEKVIITLTLVDDIETPHTEVEISRNFLKRKEIICTINGEDVNVGELETKLMHTIFPSLNISKPNFRQIIAHNIRYEDIRLNNTLDILNAFTKTEEYETLYLFLFGCDYDEGRKREELIANIKSEEVYLKRLQRAHTKSAYKVALEDVGREIIKLEDQKSKLNINPQLDKDMSDLTAIKERLNSIGSQRNSLQIRRNIIQESIAGFNDQKFEYDLAQLQLIYQQASSLIPTLQHTFEEMVEYHNRMLANRIVFIESEIPNIEKQILALTKQFEELRLQEVALTEKITTSDTFEELENIILALNKQYTLKGQYSSIIEQIEEVEKDLKKYQQELSQIDDGLFADDFQSRVDSQLSKFNAIFAEISDELYDERYAVKADVVTNRKGQRNYKFSVMETNLSSGKKQGEISCFDIAYTIFADQEGIPCLHFILNDKKELMHDHQLVTLADIANRENIQFVASILKDKLPEQLQKEEYYVVELSESKKLFMI